MNSAFNGGNFLGGAIGGISYSGSLFTNKITSTDGVNTSYKYIISPDYNDEGSAIVDEWLIAKMDINSNEYQRGETDCVPTVGKVAAKYLGMDINVRDKQRAANNSGGIYAN
ncbi:hypothetical protein [Chryseobacterium sp. 22458]|uniref:hypothetical protein n=1 Tax=Chryseobacterium sp. 22458 TaxID=3453921 RepID=UPI003F87146E